MTETLIERLRFHAHHFNEKRLMQTWDRWRVAIAGGDKGSWPRDEFESLISEVADDTAEAADALERMTERHRVLDETYGHTVGDLNEAQAALTVAQARIAELEASLGTDTTPASYFAQQYQRVITRLAEVEKERDAAQARIERLEREVLTARSEVAYAKESQRRAVLFPDQEGDGRVASPPDYSASPEPVGLGPSGEYSSRVADYLKRPYQRCIVPDTDGSYRAQIIEFPGCIATGDTGPKALARLEDVAASWISSVLASGLTIPDPSVSGRSGEADETRSGSVEDEHAARRETPAPDRQTPEGGE